MIYLINKEESIMNHFKKNAMRMFAFLGIIVLSLTVLTTVFAADVTDYTNKTTITVDGQPTQVLKK